MFVIAAVFGAVSAFVCNQVIKLFPVEMIPFPPPYQYSYSGWDQVSKKVDASLEDTGGYIHHAGDQQQTGNRIIFNPESRVQETAFRLCWSQTLLRWRR